MRNFFKKLGKTIMVAATVIGLSIPALPVKAIDGSEQFKGRFTVNNHSMTANFSKNGRTLTLNDADIFAEGKRVWCIQPDVVANATAMSNGTYTKINLTDRITAGQKKVMERLAVVGYGYNGDTSANIRFATQIKIWQLMGWSVSNVPAGVQTELNRINARLKTMTKKPITDGYTIRMHTLDNSKKIGSEDYKTIFTSPDEKAFLDNAVYGGRFMGMVIHENTDGTTIEDVVQMISRAKAVDDNVRVKVSVEVRSSDRIIFYVYVVGNKNMKSASKIYVYNDQYYENAVKGEALAYVNDYSQDFVRITGVPDPVKSTLNLEISPTAILGEVSPVKQDSETGTRTQGDATFNGAKFDLYLDEDCTVKAFDQITKEDCPSITVGADGTTAQTWKNLPVYDEDRNQRTYYVKEATAPTGYSIKATPISVKPKANKTVKATVKNTVMSGYVELTKMKIDGDQSTWSEPEEGAEFVALLKSHVDKYGDFDTAYGKKDELSAKEYSVMTTDENGYAKSGKLAYGTYILKQTKASEGYNCIEETKEIQITENSQVVKLTTAINTAEKFRVKLVKVNENGEIITYSSAKFKIKNMDTYEYVKQTIGNKTYDTFQTASKTQGKVEKGTFIVSDPDDDDYGTIMLPLELKAGDYILEEIKAPNGFSPRDIVFTVGKGYAEVIDGINYTTATVENRTMTGFLVIHKIFTVGKADKTLTDTLKEEAMNIAKDIRFDLIADENIINPTNGDVVAKKGEVYLSQNLRVIETEDEVIYETVLEGILPGKYTLKEIAPVSNFLTAKDLKVEVKCNQEERAAETYVNDKLQQILYHKPKGVSIVKPFDVINTSKTITFSKQDTGNKEIEGAYLIVVDEEDNVIDDWTSTKEKHTITGLKYGKKYRLIEVIAPETYNIANSIEFIAGEVEHVKMVDTYTEIHKKDQDNKWVVGAKLRVVDKNGETVDEWITKAEAHKVNGLKVGETYTLQEVETPKTVEKTTKLNADGTKDTKTVKYQKAADIKFTVNGEKDEIITMEDKKITTIETGIHGNIYPVIGFSVIGAAALGGLVFLVVKRIKDNKKSNKTEDKTTE